MLQERAETIGALFCLADLAVLVLSVEAAYLIRQGISHDLTDFGDYVPMFGFLVSIWLILLYRFRLYDQPRGGRAIDDAIGLLKVSVAGFLVGGALIFGLKLHFVSRLLVAIFALTAFLLLALERGLLRSLVARTAAAERSVLVVGRGKRVAEIRGILRAEQYWGVRLVEPDLPLVHLDPRETAFAVTKLLTDTVVDEVIFAVTPAELAHIESALLACERLGVPTHVSLEMENLRVAKAISNELRGLPLLTFTTTPVEQGHLLAKRVIDVVASVALIVLLAPLMLLMGTLVKLTSRGPVFFRQVRSGANGRTFVMYKFRSMCENAEALQTRLAGANEMSGPVFKIRNDPRLTPIGVFLRRSSLDELPQLWNVLKGEMSLVGPRPPLPSEVLRYESWQRRRLSMKPGLTCLWQIQGRSELADFDNWMRLDLEYIDSWSLALDLRILAKTLPAVLSGRGAA
jgi:exopolysaccharide biosynthesis polyprenyl glycosylphosphotransferase